MKINKIVMRKCMYIKKFLLPSGTTLNLGSEGINTQIGSSLHDCLAKLHNGKITSVDISGNPDVKADLNLDFPFLDNYADNIIASDVIEHLTNPFHFLKECSRVLKSNGRLILATPNANGISNILWSNSCNDPTHLYSWREHQLESLIKLAGLKIQFKRSHSWFGKRYFLASLLVKILPKYNNELFFVCGK